MRIFNGLYENNIVTIDDNAEKYRVIKCYKIKDKGYAKIRNINTDEIIEVLCSICKKTE